MDLSNLTKPKGIYKKSKRVGRGIGSGKGGHTTGRGTKGQKARKGRKPSLGFEGGQVPLYKRLPQLRGFKRPFDAKPFGIGMYKLNVFEDGTEVTPESLFKKRIITRLPKGGVKLLATGKLTKKLKLHGFIFSKSAQVSIEKSGSEIIG
ncbi:50S ribosomal protein L15 [candidate division WWE3 bacterium]|jgi:large subunit ribosomal protein L15|uniref:Large ribosomal subunit protein uL15 n=1 Tax=candidate division WWE3 bacterium TaxID=2053526 RepID=A0A3A4ZAQ1_UNCKA|nr:MAG: 50S ribosomal protein L15 [candidate division WWE3 bacterium]